MENIKEEKIWGDFVLRIPTKIASYNAKTKTSEMVENTINRNYHKAQNFTTIKTKVMTVDPFVMSDMKLQELKQNGESEVFLSELKRFQNKNVYFDFESSLMKNLEKVTNNEIRPGDTILVNGFLRAEKGKNEANKDAVYFKLATVSEKRDEKGQVILGSSSQAEIKKLYSSTFFYREKGEAFEKRKEEIERGLHQNVTVAITKVDKGTELKYEMAHKEGLHKQNGNSSYFKMKDGMYYLNAKSLDRPVKHVEGEKTNYRQVIIPIIANGLESTPLINQLDLFCGTIAVTGKAVVKSYTDKNGEKKEYIALDITNGDFTLCKSAYQIANIRASAIEKFAMPQKKVEKNTIEIERNLDF